MAKSIPWLESTYLSKKKLTFAIVLFALSINFIFTFAVIYLQKKSFSGQAVFNQAQTALSFLSRDMAEGNYRRVIEQVFSKDSPLRGGVQSIVFYDGESKEKLASKGDSLDFLCQRQGRYYEFKGDKILVCHRSNSRLAVQMIFKNKPVDFLKTTPFFLLLLFNLFFAGMLILVTSMGMNFYLDRFVVLLKKLLNKDLQDKNIPQEFEPSFKVIEELMGSLEQLKKRVSQSAQESAFNEISRKIIHNIRTPLEIIGVAASENQSLMRENMSTIRRAVGEIEVSIGKLLMGFKREMHPCNLYSLIQSAKKEVEMKHEEVVHSKFVWDVCDFSKQYERIVDNIDFKSSIVNILDNAIESCDFEGTITVQMKKYGDGVSITITDNGKGIDEKIISKIGTEGFSFGKKNGNGLGLYTAKKDIESWGGSLTIKNREDGSKGAVVEIIV